LKYEKLNVNDSVYAKVFIPETIVEIAKETDTVETDVNEQVLKSNVETDLSEERKQEIRGRLSLSSYSNLYSNSTENSHRFRYTLSLKAQNVADSRLSFESYISFRHKLNEWDAVKENLNSALKIYSLALNYELSDRLQIWLGRKINSNIANIGAIDGFQAEYRVGKFYTGAAIGSRPDFSDYGINPDLLQAGAYLGHRFKTQNGVSSSSLAFFEQRNQGNTDRRFVYFQHNNTLVKNLSLYTSVELDLYKLDNGQPSTSLTLTGLYLSMRYRFSRRFSLFGSYDSRRNVIYYETFKNYADLIIQNASRQGLRFRVNYRPWNYTTFGMDAGTRFQQNDSRRTNTLNIFGVRLSKDFFEGKFYSQAYYRFVNFRYINTGSKLHQNIAELNLSYQHNKKLYLSVNFEATFQKQENYSRIYLNIRRKF